MSHKKSEPIIPGRQPKICLVCGKASYSVGGIHPQCSVKKADQERAEKLKAKSKLSDSNKKSDESRWQKTCPKCKATLHIRRKACECGYAFRNV